MYFIIKFFGFYDFHTLGSVRFQLRCKDKYDLKQEIKFFINIEEKS